ncbi:MAG TPA: SCP2 sterol-binding domain-containing protein [Pilimelia sp.]|nr:SCP2 sterol-binding domain-containing protein [Pilimelia sp.]
MTELDPATFASVNAQQFAQLVKTTPDAQLKQVMQSESRGQILAEIFNRFPTLFRADRAGDTEAVIHWNITDKPGGGTDSYEVEIANHACTVSDAPHKEPRVALTMGPVEFLKIVSGNGNPVMMFMTGKLKAKGDLSLAADIAKLFDMPK